MTNVPNDEFKEIFESLYRLTYKYHMTREGVYHRYERVCRSIAVGDIKETREDLLKLERFVERYWLDCVKSNRLHTLDFPFTSELEGYFETDHFSLLDEGWDKFLTESYRYLQLYRVSDTHPDLQSVENLQQRLIIGKLVAIYERQRQTRDERTYQRRYSKR